MSWLRRLGSSFRKRRLEDQLDDELQFHLEMRTEEFMAAGMAPEEARYRARHLFGNELLIKERTRDMDTLGWLDSFWQDLAYAARTLRKSPGLVAVVVLSLALGIGANSTIFSVMNPMLYLPLPYERPDRLMMIWETEQGRPDSRMPPPIAEIVDWQKQSHVFEDLALTSFSEPTPLAGNGEPENATAQFVTPNFFHVMRVSPLMGRVFLAREAQDRTQTIIISDSFWERRFHKDPGVLGKVFNISGVISTVVGVMPPGFGSFFGDRLDMWVPIDPASTRYSERKDHWLSAIGRLKPGATQKEAQVEMDVIARRLEQVYPATNKGVGAKVVPLRQGLYGEWAQAVLFPLLGAVGFVLLIACVNAANLMLSRSETRRREFALRASLGAGRGRLMQQLFAESALLGILGGLLGAALTLLGIQLFRALAWFFPNLDSIRIDSRVLLFTLAISLLTAILVGCVPALQASNVDLNLALREGDRRTGTGSRSRTRHVLAVAEVALAMVLLVGAGLMIRSVVRLGQVNPGFDFHNVLSFEISLPEGGNYVERVPGGDIERASRQVAEFYRRLLDKLAAFPGVDGACFMSPFNFGRTFSILGRPIPAPDRRPSALWSEISPSYFRTLKIPLKKGRNLTDADSQTSPWVAVVNETFAHQYFPNEDPIGKQLLLRNAELDEPHPRQIVGVVGDTKWYLAQGRQRPTVYASYLQQPSDFRGGTIESHLAQMVMMRSASPLGDGEAGLVTAAKKAVAEVNPEQPINDVLTLEQMFARGTGDYRFYAHVLEIFASIALLLALIGIYGSMSYFVAARTREIGIRVALGASRGGIVRLVTALGLRIAVIGVVIGIAMAIGLTRVIARFLFGVTATDPATFAIVGLGLVAVALAACSVPARRATRVDPMDALRHE